jgi:thioredoxin-like negative regulator of GroEL
MGRPLSPDELRPTQAPPPTGDAPALAGDVPDKADPRFQMLLAEANKAYDRQDFDEARSIATRALAKDPTNTRMLRIMVSSHCIEGDSASAQTYYDKLPEFDRQQMAKRCATYGVTFK